MLVIWTALTKVYSHMLDSNFKVDVLSGSKLRRCSHFCHMALLVWAETCSLREASSWLGTVSWNIALKKEYLEIFQY
jgi:hypothetical protein